MKNNLSEQFSEMKIFIGYDSREKVASDVCILSINKFASKKFEIDLLNQKELKKKKIYTRDIDPLSSTEFTFTRFLVPYLMNYKGWAVFCDCDFLWIEDINKLFELRDDKYAVMCVQHDYKPNQNIKMDNKKQHTYPRKNWSSMVLWNCGHYANQKLTPDVVNSQTGKYLHRFGWLEDKYIGEINHEWNWLVGWYNEPKDGRPKALHFTEGGPWFKNHQNNKYSDIWSEFANINNINFKKI